MIKKGIFLAGGKGSRMSPLTKSVNKQLLPIYDKPLIFYPLSILMLAKIKDILIIVNKGQLDQYKKLIPNGNNLGIKISYLEQDKPRGLPDAFVLGEKFIGKESVAMILGDNFFYGQNLTSKLLECAKIKKGAKVLLHSVHKPELFGVAKVDKNNKRIRVVHLDKVVKSSRSIDIINYLINKKKLKNIYFIIGSDNLINFHKWKGWKKIAKLTKLIVFSRKGYDRNSKKSIVAKYLKNKIIFINNKPIIISSSKLRKQTQTYY